MLKYLQIQNIILVEQAHIPFGSGLNVLTGETGSGKSAIMHGLSLAAGERADTGLIRRGCDKGVVEAVFDIDQHPILLNLLQESGIEHELGQELIIRREIAASGKGRLFINHQPVQLTLLRQIGMHLVQIVGQHANQSLFSTDHHRDLVDLYGDLDSLLKTYQNSFNQAHQLKQELDSLIQQEAQRLREIDLYQRELEELNEAQLKEGEDEELFSEYTLLSHSRELSDKLQEVTQSLTSERQAVLSNLYRQKSVLDSIAHFDPFLGEMAKLFQNAFMELQEVSHSLRQYHQRIQNDPERLNFINDRLTLISRIKRKYGSTIAEIQHYQSQAQSKLTYLENADIQIDRIKTQLKLVEEQTTQLALQLTEERKKAAQRLAQDLTEQLHSLNMSKAEFIINVTEQKRSTLGQDKVEFFLCPNVGEHQIAIKDGASGGEISRVLLALQTLLAGKQHISTLIFDEVDANVGGETATIVGDKLKEIGYRHQVICITHFPQVASQAHHHLQISKQEKEGRTVTLVQCLDQPTRKQELERMLGGRNSFDHKKKKSPALK